jgi:hypothetical protein
VNQFQAPGESHTYGGGFTNSLLHPVYLVIILIVIALILTLPRKYMVVVFVLGIFSIPLGQQVYAAGVHWLAGRLITLAGLLRVTMLNSSSRRNLLVGGFNSMDRVFFACVICQAVSFVLLYLNAAAVIYEFGFLIDFLAAYLVVRVMIQDEADIYRTLKCLAVITVILAIGTVWEQMALQNVFGLLGGTQAVPTIREGKIRSQGVFQHALTAGSFAATSLPLYLMLWKNGKSRVMAAAGLAACTVMTICSNSSTPLLAWVAGLGAVCLWPIRKQMRTLRRILVITLIALHLAMKAPVWFLIARIDLTGSSSGYHRAELVDQFIRHFSEWWLIGTNNAGNWGWDLWDQQNQFVNVGEAGGLLALILFIVVIKQAYSRIGTSRRSLERTNREWQMWFLGAALFSNLVSFFGANYYDQSKVTWFILLAMIIAATSAIGKSPVISLQKPESWWDQDAKRADEVPA